MIEEEIKFNTVGRILSDKYKDWYIFVEDDSDDLGGYLILISKDPDIYHTREGYDIWAEDMCDLKAIFRESYPKIQWLE